MPVYHFMVGWHGTMQPFKRIQVTAIDTVTGKRTTERTDLNGVVRISTDNEARIVVHTTEPYELLGLTAVGTGPFEYDYLVDLRWATMVANRHGTEGQSFTTFHGHPFEVYSTLTGATAAAITSASTSGEKTILVVSSITEGEIDIGGLGSSASIVIYGPDRYAVIITATANDDIFDQDSTGGAIAGRLVFRNIGLAPATDKAVLDINTASELKVLAFENCNFTQSGAYLVRQDGSDRMGNIKLRVRHCTGALAGFYQVGGTSVTMAPDSLEAFDNKLTLTAWWDGGSSNATPSESTRVDTGFYTITNGITTQGDGPDEFHWANLMINFAGNEALFTSPVNSDTGNNWSWRGIILRTTHVDGTFLNLGGGTAQSPHDNIYIQSIFGYSTVSPTGTFIKVDMDLTNVHVGDIHAPKWATLYSGPVEVGDDHGLLGGLSDDDHSQYLLLAGRGGQLITDQVQIQDTNFHVDLGSSYADHVAAHSPVAYWRLGESLGDFADSSGNGHTGTPFGSITYGATGALTLDSNTAITLDPANNDYFTAADHADFDLGDGPFTLEAWIKKAADGTAMWFFNKGVGAYGLRMNVGNNLELVRDNVLSICTSTVTITGTAWHHVAASKTGAAVKLYIDGIDVTGAITNSTMVDTATALYIGRRWDGSQEWDGDLDELAVYSSVLTGAQILAHYNEGNGGVTLRPRVTMAPNDYFEYNRESNYFSWVIGSTEFLRVGDTDTQLDFFNGSILETTRIAVTSDGAVVTLALDKAGGGDLTLVFSDGYTTLNTTPAATVVLTPGSDTSPQTNYVYILQSNKTLTVSTSGFPSAEHYPIAVVILQSAATTQTENALVVHVWHDHAEGSDEQGHASHLGRWIRKQAATYDSGVAQTLTITTNAGTPDNVDFATTAGEVFQMHLHTVPAFDTSTGTNVHVVNDSISPYTPVTDLADLLTDSAGGSMSGRYFNLVIWASVSEETDETHLFVNLPSGSYNKQGDAVADVSGFTDFNIPSDFRGTAFLISLLTLRHQAASGGTWTSIQEINLRGTFPNTVAGGGTSAITTEFADNAFKVVDEGDPTKELAFQVSGVSASTLRTLTVPNASGIIALTAQTDGTIDASDVGYTPAVAADWDGDADPGDMDDVADQLAARVTDVEERGVFEANSSTSFLWGTSGVWLDQTPFIGTINGSPSATSIVYNHTSGELSISPGQVIHNTTLGERACITAINTATNTITVEADSPDDVSGWSNTDAITTASQTNTGRGGIFVDIDANRVLGGASVVALNLSLSGALRNADLHFVITHPYEAYNVAKENTIMYLQDALNQYKQWVQPVEVVNSRHYFTMCFLLLAADNNTGQCRLQGQFTKLVA